jgi:hypothetical protein
MASLLLGGILAFWGQLSTGAAACFSSLAPPPGSEGATGAEEPTKEVTRPSSRRIQIKRVKRSP